MLAQWFVGGKGLMAVSWLVLLLLMFVSTSQQSVSAKDTQVVTATQDQKSAEASVTTNHELQVRLPSQPGTGFSWQLLRTPSLVKLKGQSTEPPDKSRPGAWQMQMFRFQAGTPGSETLQFGYRRLWEKDTPPAKTFSLVVTITKSN